MKISFKPINDSHFTILLSWLQLSHVRKYLDQDINYTIDLVKEKYEPYIKNNKQIGNKQQSIYAFIIYCDAIPVGYIQYYNFYDFNDELENLPKSLASLEMFIGEKVYLCKGVATKALALFLDEYVYAKFDYAFVSPKVDNMTAIKVFEKVGFVVLRRIKKKFYMVASKKIVRLSTKDAISLEITFRKYWLLNDSLWIFGSRADLTKKGGDIDLYIETNAKTID